MYTYLQQALPRVLIHRTQVVKKEWKLRGRFSPTKENRIKRRSLQRLTKTVLVVCGVQVKIRTKISRYRMFSLFRLCFVFYGEIYVKNG